MAATITSVSSGVADDNDNQSGSTGSNNSSKANYFFPNALKDNTQDYIRFTAFQYKGGTLSSSSVPSPTVATTSLSSAQGTVSLPIQSGISDSNMVSWGQDELNALDSYVASAAYESIIAKNSDGRTMGGAEIKGVVENVAEVTGNYFTKAANIAGNYKKEIALYFAGRAANVNNLLARVEGKVLNPNMELLFQGPALRPFTFAFRLSPRDHIEARNVKDIIRFFKKRMAPIRSEANLFLEAPHVFKIEYMDGQTGNLHASLNRIKLCALQTCNVDYTPDGNYATFRDGSMTSYGLSLQFTELEPVYYNDYKDLKNGEIGF